MNKEEMLNQLYDYFKVTKDQYDASIENLSNALRTNKAAQANLEQPKSELAALESNVVLGETHPKGRVSGKNAAERQHQTTLLLAEFRLQDPTGKSLVNDIELAHQSLNSSSVAIQTIRAQLGRHQAVAEMIAGLATALGGQL